MTQQAQLFSSSDLRCKAQGESALVPLRAQAMSCQACRLHETRNKVVFGIGRPEHPPVVFIGEGPGANEDEQGEPFIGRAGQLLDKMIGAMGFNREQIYICNVVCCRPPENRRPKPDEVAACSRFLTGQISAVQPKVIVALGAAATEALLKSKKSMAAMRGTWHEWAGIPLRATYHPSYLLRDPSMKPQAWEDLQAVLGKL